MPRYAFLASQAILLWIGGERVFFSLATSFLPASEGFPLLCSYTASLPSPSLFLLFFCVSFSSKITNFIMFPPPFIQTLIVVLSFSLFPPSLPQCSFVLRFNAPKQAFCVSPLRVSAGALCSPFCLCCENRSQSCLGTHAHGALVVWATKNKHTYTQRYTHCA